MHERYDDDSALLRRERAPSPGLAAVLSVFVPGLGHVYSGRLGTGLGWFLATVIGYHVILVPGFLIHVASVWFAYEAARRFRGD